MREDQGIELATIKGELYIEWSLPLWHSAYGLTNMETFTHRLIGLSTMFKTFNFRTDITTQEGLPVVSK